MSLEKKKDNDLDQSSCRPRSVEEAIGSHYALQVALQTMKERCQHLQERLGVVEEENLRLRIENRKRKSDSASASTADELKNEPRDSKSKIDHLEEKVALLTRQKSQLTHHLFMVATENRQLWNRLSHLTQANQNLGSHLSKISSTLSRHHSTSSITISKSQSPTSSLTHGSELNLSSNSVLSKKNNNVTKKGTDTGCEDVKEPSVRTAGDVAESLEEISLKLIKSFLQEKTELEEQYAQMVEIQSGSSSYSVQNLGFGYLEDGGETIEDMKQHHKKLLELRDLLKEQQTVMKTVVINMERVKKGGAICSRCQKKSRANLTLTDSDADIEDEVESLRKWGIPDGTSYSEGIQRQLDQVAEPPAATGNISTPRMHVAKREERMCPMCGKLYDGEIPFKTFQQHVSDHFPDEEESDSILNNFEVVT